MNKLLQKYITIIMLIIISFNFIFPNFAYAYKFELLESGNHYHFIAENEEEEAIIKEIERVITKNIRNAINKQIDSKIGVENYDQVTESRAAEVSEEIADYMFENIYNGSDMNKMSSFYGDLKTTYLSNNIVEDYVNSLEFYDIMDALYSKVESGEYLKEFLGNDGHTGEDIKESEESRYGTPEDPLSGSFLGGILDGVLGLILYPIKLLFIIPIAVTRVAMNSVAGGQDVSLQNIFFNKIDLLNINIFESKDDAIASKIAQFYLALRNLSIALSLAVLIYIGIRMATNSIAGEKAKYKGMLVNWLVGFALIFVMQYIMYFIIKANELLVESLSSQWMSSSIMKELAGLIWVIPFTKSFSALAMYIGLLLMSFIFLITYIKRMITVSFLIVISPLITVTYSIDKVRK